MTSVLPLVDGEDAVWSNKTSVRFGGRYGAHCRTLHSEWPNCRKLDIVSCIHFIRYRRICVHEGALKTCIIVKNTVIFVLWICYEMYVGRNLPTFLYNISLHFLVVKQFLSCLALKYKAFSVPRNVGKQLTVCDSEYHGRENTSIFTLFWKQQIMLATNIRC